MRRLPARSVLVVGSLLVGAPGAAIAGCDATVSPTAIGLAGDDVRKTMDVALESFGIDPSFGAVFQPGLQDALRERDPRGRAAALTSALRDLCRAFNGAAGDGIVRVREGAGGQSRDVEQFREMVRAREPDEQFAPPASVTGVSTRDALRDLDRLTKGLDTTTADEAKPRLPDDPKASELRPKRTDRIAAAEAVDGGGDTDDGGDECTGGDSDDQNVTPSWLARPPVNRTKQQIELDVLDAKANLDAVQLNRTLNDRCTDDADVAEARARFRQAEQNALILLPNYGLYFGPNYTQNSSGGFDAGIEAYGHWDSGRHYYAAGITPGWYRGFFDASFQDTDVDAEETAEETPPEGGGEEGAEGEEDFDIFGRDKGRLRVNAGVQWHPFVGLGEASDWLGVVGGLGFTAPQVLGAGDTLNRGGVRWFAGLHSVTRYRYGLGELTLGYANDKFWKTTCHEDPAQALAGCGDFSDRYFLEGLFNLVNPEATDWSLIGKISADIPTGSGGESDVVISVMLRRDLSGYFTKLTKP